MKSEKGFIVKLGLILFLISAICVFALALCNSLTKDKIAAINQKKEDDAKKSVLSSAETFKQADYKNDGGTVIFIGEKGGEKVGYCARVTSKGFGGDIDMMVGLDSDFAISGVTIINMSETPGLGSRASDEKFIKQYDNLKGLDGEIDVIKSGTPEGNEIVAISGATVTSKAVTRGVNAAVSAVKEMEGIQ